MGFLEENGLIIYNIDVQQQHRVLDPLGHQNENNFAYPTGKRGKMGSLQTQNLGQYDKKTRISEVTNNNETIEQTAQIDKGESEWRYLFYCNR